MTTHFSLSEAANLKNPRFRLGMMREVVEHVHARGDLYMPLLNLVTTFIDGLAAGPPDGTKKAYSSTSRRISQRFAQRYRRKNSTRTIGTARSMSSRSKMGTVSCETQGWAGSTSSHRPCVKQGGHIR